MNLRDYMMKNQGRYPKLGAKPKKGDRIRDNITGETYEIDMISRGAAFTKPKEGKIERIGIPFKYLTADKNQNIWLSDY